MNQNESPQASSVVEKRERTESPSNARSWFMVMGIAGQIGYIIAIPAVVFVMGGTWLDSYFGTKPLFTLIGIPVALMASGLAVWNLIKKLK